MDDSKIIDGKKYMWDGEDYESESAAQENISTYSKNDFETKLIEENGKFLLYTRRQVSEIVVASDGR